MPLAISRTAPFRYLQKQIGSATYRLNTILVGLEAVADGASKSPRLPVTWNKPTDLHQARSVADQGSIFACTSALVLAADVFDQFLSNFVTEGWLNFSGDTINIVTKAKTRSKEDGGAYSVAERTIALLKDLHLSISPAVGGVELLSKWRNVSVHSKERKNNIHSEMESLLTQSKIYFYEHYSHFRIDLALRNFRGRKNPVPKEATSLIAAVQNISGTLDEAAIRRAAGTTEAIAITADRLLSEYFCDGERLVPGFGELAEALQGPRERRLANLIKILQRVGITETAKVVSAVLPDSYIDGILESSRGELVDRFKIHIRSKSD